MDRQVLADELADAMRDVQDMDTGFSDYAKAAVEALGWRSLAKELPEERDMVIATDGKYRWMDMYLADAPGMRWQGHVATHWHPVLDLADINT